MSSYPRPTPTTSSFWLEVSDLKGTFGSMEVSFVECSVQMSSFLRKTIYIYRFSAEETPSSWVKHFRTMIL